MDRQKLHILFLIILTATIICVMTSASVSNAKSDNSTSDKKVPPVVDDKKSSPPSSKKHAPKETTTTTDNPPITNDLVISPDTPTPPTKTPTSPTPSDSNVIVKTNPVSKKPVKNIVIDDVKNTTSASSVTTTGEVSHKGNVLDQNVIIKNDTKPSPSTTGGNKNNGTTPTPTPVTCDNQAYHLDKKTYNCVLNSNCKITSDKSGGNVTSTTPVVICTDVKTHKVTIVKHDQQPIIKNTFVTLSSAPPKPYVSSNNNIMKSYLANSYDPIKSQNLLLLNAAQLCAIANDINCVILQSQFATMGISAVYNSQTQQWDVTGSVKVIKKDTTISNIEANVLLYDVNGNNVGKVYDGLKVSPNDLSTLEDGMFKVSIPQKDLGSINPSFLVVNYDIATK